MAESVKQNDLSRQKTIDLVNDLSVKMLSPDDLNLMADRCTDIYQNIAYRHSYSEITSYIIECFETDKAEKIEMLTANVTGLKGLVENNIKYDGLYEPIFKLWDHIQLEAVRISIYTKSRKSEIELLKQIEMEQLKLDNFKKEMENDDANSLRATMAVTKESIKKSNKLINRATIEARNIQTQVVSILGIFSAIIIAFFGGLSYLGNALNNINAVSKFRLTFMVAVIGLIIINLVFVLLYYISKMIEKPIKSNCKSSSCISCTGIKGKGECGRFFRVAKRYPYIFWVNILLISFCIGVFIVWMFSNWIVLPLQ